MKSVFITPGLALSGTLAVPGDKSITHRALLISALATGESTITEPLVAEDTLATANVLRELGVECELQENPWRLRSSGLHAFRRPKKDLECGNSGTTARLLMGVLAAQKFPSRLVGDASLSRRPMERVMEPLRKMGARFEGSARTLPLRILPAPEGGLEGISYHSPIASAQVKSACLLAGLYARGVTIFSEPQLSRDHSERMLSAVFSVRRERRPMGTQSRFQVRLTGPAGRLAPANFHVPGDFSAAAFFLVGACLARKSRVELLAVGNNPTRLGLYDALAQMGGELKRGNEEEKAGEPLATFTAESSNLRATEVSGDLTLRALDEIPIWGVAAARAKGLSVLGDASELRVKESDRLLAIAENLKRLGVHVETKSDGLVIEGRESLIHPKKSGHGPGFLESFGDHRIAMASVIATLAIDEKEEEVEIRDVECIATSYPNFFRDLRQLTGGRGVRESE